MKTYQITFKHRKHKEVFTILANGFIEAMDSISDKYQAFMFTYDISPKTKALSIKLIK
jgi:elongation factor P hydroxylase